jgi:hypothetical protein
MFLFIHHNIAQPAADSINGEEVLRRLTDKIISENFYEFDGTYKKQTYKACRKK